MAQENHMEETTDGIDYLHDCNCLKKKITQRYAHLIIRAPFTEGEMFCLCIYQFMILLTMYLFMLKMNTVEYCLQIFITIVNDTISRQNIMTHDIVIHDIVSHDIIELVAQTIKIMMTLYMVEELRIVIKSLLCKCE
jgi:hypothetical protein